MGDARAVNSQRRQLFAKVGCTHRCLPEKGWSWRSQALVDHITCNGRSEIGLVRDVRTDPVARGPADGQYGPASPFERSIPRDAPRTLRHRTRHRRARGLTQLSRLCRRGLNQGACRAPAAVGSSGSLRRSAWRRSPAFPPIFSFQWVRDLRRIGDWVSTMIDRSAAQGRDRCSGPLGWATLWACRAFAFWVREESKCGVFLSSESRLGGDYLLTQHDYVQA